jgi:hypothetical protein
LLKTDERKTVQHGGFSPHFLAASKGGGSNGTGYSIHLNQSTLFAAPFDLNRLALTGTVGANDRAI